MVFYLRLSLLAAADVEAECSSLSGACLVDISWAAPVFRLCLTMRISRWGREEDGSSIKDSVTCKEE
jgi:hypothetical protein